VLLGDPGPDVPAGEAAAGWAGYVVCGDGCGVQAEIARRDIPNMHNRFIWSSLGKCANDCPDRFMRCWRGSVAERETKPPVSSPTMQKLEKFHGPVRGTPGVRWRVVDGASPNVARYVPAKRPSRVNPKRWATSATLTLSGWASRSARRTSFNRRAAHTGWGPCREIPRSTTEGSGRSPRSGLTVPAGAEAGSDVPPRPLRT